MKNKSKLGFFFRFLTIFSKSFLLLDHKTWFTGISGVFSGVFKIWPCGQGWEENFSRGQPPQDNNVGSGVVWVTGLFSLCNILEPTGLIFMIRKPCEKSPLVLDAHWLGHFCIRSPRGLKRAQILSGVWYMSMNTELSIYRGHILKFNTRCLFTPAPDICYFVWRKHNMTSMHWYQGKYQLWANCFIRWMPVVNQGPQKL